jgi:2-oxoisovalerate dehydrogenase E2 component (dihydrolipoyl transacylase)
MMHNEERGTEVTVPHLAESLVSATVGKWLKHPGDYVHEYDVLCELMTDKVNVEMPAPFEGTMIRIYVQEGENAEVGAPICLIREPEAQREAAKESVKTETSKEVEEGDGSQDGIEGKYRDRYSPAVLRLAKEYQTDLRKVKGTGLGGRITRKDILAYVKNSVDVNPVAQPEPAFEKKASAANTVEAANAAFSAQVHKGMHANDDTKRLPEDQVLPVSRIRSTIASRMRQSVSEIPHAWIMIEVDVSSLVALRQKWKEDFASKEGVRLTLTPFVMKAIVNAIKDYPIVNSIWDSEKIIVKKDIHLSIAVGSKDAVVTPVIQYADRKTIAGLAIELNDLVRRARTGKLTLSDMQEGTFTFNNTGSFGSVLSYPIINYPQAAIITFESIIRKPVVIGDGISIRSMANLCLSLDHRILDGMICGSFMQRVKHYLEQYNQDTAIY